MNSIIAVEVKKSLGTIQDNLDAVEASIKERIEEYKGIVVTEDSIKDGKQAVADIRKEQKALDDSRKAIKKEWMAPYEAFENKAKRVIKLYDEPINAINGQLLAFEEERKEVKRKRIADIYENADKGEYADWLTLDGLFNEKWLNATYRDTQIKEDIEDAFARLSISISSIKAMESEFEQAGLDVLRKTGDFQRAVQEITQRKKMKEEIIAKEQEKAEAFAKAQAEAKEAAEKAQTFIPPNADDDIPFEPERMIEVVVRVRESALDDFKALMEFNKYAYEVKE
ncbi:MAG: DUF1351 domain-containing protein [Clostridium sp.]|nr:DUF1351 domain-containing protein [Clostridium sp.]MCM1459699.1 DUF1351 domain-containing protein [Bacteroides sp.]